MMDDGSLLIQVHPRSSAHHRVAEALEASLEALGVDYIDLYLMHWPQALIPDEGQPLITMQGRFASPSESPTFNETWADMEKLLDSGTHHYSAS
jgi:glycerol 2-dehydrogenase (NADP+)